MKFEKNVIGLLVFAMCVLLVTGCAVQTASEEQQDQADTTASSQTASDSASSSTSSGGATSGSAGVSGSGFSEQEVTDSGSGASASAESFKVEKLMRIHFEFDSYELQPEARQTLEANAAYLKTSPDAKIVIEGHCDERGSDEYNLALGERRAKAAKRYLQSLGVDTSRLKTISYGEEKPLDPRSTEAAWAKNRRAEFTAR